MLWFTIWTLLVLGTLAGGFFLGRDLWRKGKALLAELGRAGELAEALSARADELAELAQTPAPGHDLFADRSGPLERLAVLRTERAGRREVRRLRNDRIVRGWRAYTR
ncbi:hypothetical protein [Pengzhenrongella sicca]|uniref:Uncharacterized protein n=1 Tax=Pengzhenrongella sicca TaxID=2819238 RepID=A0A8A4Z7P9_9MICO|nr:hypothetical protein [Pengzhenrongella sicca]QTE27834.1 hypothetical protein J4E96_10390 [Pengzhenrongella sicca]